MMDRDHGLRRTRVLTGALVAASLAGTLGVGIAAYAADGSSATTVTDSTVTDSTVTDSTVTDSGSAADSPSMSSTDDDSGQATSGGS